MPPCTLLELGLVCKVTGLGPRCPMRLTHPGDVHNIEVTITGSGRFHRLLNVATYRCQCTYWFVSSQSVFILKRFFPLKEILSVAVTFFSSFPQRNMYKNWMRKKLKKSGSIESMFRVTVQRCWLSLKNGCGQRGHLTVDVTCHWMLIDQMRLWGLKLFWAFALKGVCHMTRWGSHAVLVGL